jgi:predicted Zn-dependent protease with MMP-like domain
VGGGVVGGIAGNDIMIMAARNRTTRWTGGHAPTIDEIATLTDQAFQSLPEEFRALCGDLIVRVEDFADEETLEELGCESPFELLGLFRGVGLAHASVTHPNAQPNMIFLYRRAILDYWAEHEETLTAIVTHVLVHEIGHHFGLSDDDMMRIEAEAEPDSGTTVQ